MIGDYVSANGELSVCVCVCVQCCRPVSRMSLNVHHKCWAGSVGEVTQHLSGSYLTGGGNYRDVVGMMIVCVCV